VQQFVIYLVVGLLFLAASSLVVYSLVAMQTEQQHAWVPATTTHCILASTVTFHFSVNISKWSYMCVCIKWT
jgi:hypothetical protein